MTGYGDLRQHKVDCYFDHSLTLKLVEFFLLAEKFLLPAEVKRAALDKLAFIQKSKDSPDSEPLPFELINQAFDRTSLHVPLRTLILDYVSFDYLDKNSFMTRIRDELLREGSTFDVIIFLEAFKRPPNQRRLPKRDTELQSRTN